MQLFIALDLPTMEENLELIKNIGNAPVWLKVGFRSYIRDGKEFLKEIKEINPQAKIFLDLKLYDIPNTMADAAEEIAQLGVNMFNIHASAGEIAMREVMERLDKIENRPFVLAVTALTSFDDKTFESIYEKAIEEKAMQFAKMSYDNGLDGVVCSAFESKMIKDATSKEFLTLCPAIRPFGEDACDQTRVATLDIARDEMVDFPVVGRPVYKDADPALKVEKILKIIDSFKY